MPTLFSKLAGIVLMAFAFTASAQSPHYPDRPIRMVVPWPAGGVVDTVARVLMPKVSKTLGQSIVIENRDGAGGIIGANEVAKSKPDGYTLMMAFDNLAVAPSVYKDMPFDPFTDLAPVSLLVRAPLVLVATAGLAPNTLPELIEYAKKRPGQVSYGSTGPGSSSHLTAELFAQAAGISLLHIPYKGGAPAQNDLMGGHLDLFWGSTAWTKSMVQSGKVKALGQAGLKRSAIYPDLPTVAEQGVANFEAYLWMGVAAPKGTPNDVITRWRDALVSALNEPSTKDRFAGLGFEVVASTPAEFGRFMRDEHDKWTRVIKDAHIALR
ncbi:MAG: tripartite tricarboxylate transporter substrate binding protein [Burkholderiaceae bacterium]